MSTRNTRSLIALAATLFVAAPLAFPMAASSVVPKPKVSTGGARHNLGTSAQLTGSVNPNGVPTSYFFQWGTTTAYGLQTPTANVGSGISKVRVAQTIVRLIPGQVYHFRIVAVYGAGTQVPGRDRTFSAKLSGPKIAVPKTLDEVYGTPFIISGVLQGANSAHRLVSLQATTFPFREPFTTLGIPATTDAAGRFSFRVTNLVQSTAFHIVTIEAHPEISPTIMVHALARVVLHVRTSARKGLVRLYGTVFPAEVGAKVLIQLNKPVNALHPSKSEAETRFATQFSTVTKKAGTGFSRFSMIVKVLHTGRYRAMVKLRPGGPVQSGSSSTVVLHAGPASKHGKKK